jgi:hypothetical protein
MQPVTWEQLGVIVAIISVGIKLRNKLPGILGSSIVTIS